MSVSIKQLNVINYAAMFCHCWTTTLKA